MQRLACNEWNDGWPYGGKSYPHHRVWMIGVAGVGAESYAKRHYDAAMRTQLEVGMLEFCGIEERRFELLYSATDGEPHPSAARAHMRSAHDPLRVACW
jgi:NAD(P)H dehydrogenase (quinone)